MGAVKPSCGARLKLPRNVSTNFLQKCLDEGGKDWADAFNIGWKGILLAVSMGILKCFRVRPVHLWLSPLQDVDGNEDHEVDASGAESLSCVEFPLIRRVLHVLCPVVNLGTAKHSFMAAIATELYGFCTWLGVSFVTGIRTDVLLLQGFKVKFSGRS